MANANKVTFGKMESVSGMWDDHKRCDVLLNGALVGEIDATVESFSVNVKAVHVVSYTLTIWADAGDTVITFGVPNGAKAQTILATAKAQAREVLAAKEGN